jgi:hypothetical protein
MFFPGIYKNICGILYPVGCFTLERQHSKEMNIATDNRLQRPEIGSYDPDPSDTRQSLMVDLTRPEAEIRQLEADTGPHRKLHRAQADRARDVQAHAAHYMQKIGLALAPRPMVFAHARANLSAGRPRATRRTAARSGSRGDPDEPPAPLGADEFSPMPAPAGVLRWTDLLEEIAAAS